MRRLPALAAVLAATVLLPACMRARGGGTTSAGDAGLETARRIPMALVLDQGTVATGADSFTFSLRLTNPASRAVLVDFTGDPPFPRGQKEKVPIPALWWTIERSDVASEAGSVHRPYARPDTVLAAGGAFTVPVTHSLREVGLSPGEYRIRAGIGAHATGWEKFTVTR
jgi:hypothetical protein